MKSGRPGILRRPWGVLGGSVGFGERRGMEEGLGGSCGWVGESAGWDEHGGRQRFGELRAFGRNCAVVPRDLVTCGTRYA